MSLELLGAPDDLEPPIIITMKHLKVGHTFLVYFIDLLLETCGYDVWELISSDS